MYSLNIKQIVITVAVEREKLISHLRTSRKTLLCIMVAIGQRITLFYGSSVRQPRSILLR